MMAMDECAWGWPTRLRPKVHWALHSTTSYESKHTPTLTSHAVVIAGVNPARSGPKQPWTIDGDWKTPMSLLGRVMADA
jgi:hypothetical protein